MQELYFAGIQFYKFCHKYSPFLQRAASSHYFSIYYIVVFCPTQGTQIKRCLNGVTKIIGYFWSIRPYMPYGENLL